MEEEWIKEWTEEQFNRNQQLEEDKDIRNQFDISVFTRLQKSFMVATGLNGNIVDRNGLSITEIMDDRAPKFCAMIHTVPEGYRRCTMSDQRTTAFSIAQQKGVVCRCHAGLYDSAIPIQFKQHGMGAFITGQVLLESPTEEDVDNIVKRVSDLGLDRDELIEAIREIPVITKEKLTATTEFMQILVDYIVKSLEEAELSRREAEWRSLLRETEMKVIQSKLHPHFLFNILNLISGQALLENATNTYTTVNYLSKMLRYIIKSYRPLVTLEEEMENLDSYVRLQCLRFEDRLSFQVQVQDSALKTAMLPSLTMQILIENAIKHGIEPKEGAVYVHCSIYADDGRMVIEVEDNGIGMDEDRLRELNDGQSDFANQLSGLSMIRKRLDYFYAGDFRFSVESAAGEGTKVLLSVPVIESE